MTTATGMPNWIATTSTSTMTNFAPSATASAAYLFQPSQVAALGSVRSMGSLSLEQAPANRRSNRRNKENLQTIYLLTTPSFSAKCWVTIQTRHRQHTRHRNEHALASARSPSGKRHGCGDLRRPQMKGASEDLVTSAETTNSFKNRLSQTHSTTI